MKTPCPDNVAMFICARCHASSPSDALYCEKCGVGFPSQMRVQAATHRAQVGKGVRAVTWIVAMLALGCIAPPVYRTVGEAYLRYHLKWVRASVMNGCNGPVVPGMRAADVRQINQCYWSNPELVSAQTDYDHFVKSHAR